MPKALVLVVTLIGSGLSFWGALRRVDPRAHWIEMYVQPLLFIPGTMLLAMFLGLLFAK